MAELKERYRFECKCFVCSNEIWSPLNNVLDFSNDPIYKEAVKLSTMTATQVRKLPRDAVADFEKKAAEFLQKYDRLHPVNATMSIGETLLHYVIEIKRIFIFQAIFFRLLNQINSCHI